MLEVGIATVLTVTMEIAEDNHPTSTYTTHPHSFTTLLLSANMANQASPNTDRNGRGCISWFVYRSLIM